MHTPHDWTPVDLHRMALAIKNLNLSAGLDTFVILAGTGTINIHLFNLNSLTTEGREWILDCKLDRYPKTYIYVLPFVS